jgi:hypothetical protein
LLLKDSSITMLMLSQSDAIYFRIRSKHSAWSTVSDSSVAKTSTISYHLSLMCITKIAIDVQRQFIRYGGLLSEAIFFRITIKAD